MHAPAQLGMHLVVNMIIQQAVATSTQTTMHFMPKACDNQLEKLCNEKQTGRGRSAKRPRSRLKFQIFPTVVELLNLDVRTRLHAAPRHATAVYERDRWRSPRHAAKRKKEQSNHTHGADFQPLSHSIAGKIA